MRVGFLNCHGLSGKADPIKLLAQENSVDIMILTETWLKPNDSTLDIPELGVPRRFNRFNQVSKSK